VLSGRALLVADAAPRVGLGHLARSTGLAQALLDERVETICVALGAAEPIQRGGVEWVPAPDLNAIALKSEAGDVVVLDSYELKTEQAREWAGEAPLVVFWDEGDPPPADLIISIALDAPSGIRSLTGAQYACLGRDYWEPPAVQIPEGVERILVAAGGADPTHAATEFCAAARDAVPRAEVTLVQSLEAASPADPAVKILRSPPSPRDSLLASDLMVSAAGQTMLEALATGTPCVALPVASNQRPGAEMLAEMGAVQVVEPASPEALRETIRRMAGDAEARSKLSATGMQRVDGRGATRLAAELKSREALPG
jgi:spore coat polysaccharide biosynthesis predicted glycosyltransferase SpsG